MTVPGELARVTGLSRAEAGLGNRALVAEGFADMLSPGTYRLPRRVLAAGLQTGLSSICSISSASTASITTTSISTVGMMTVERPPARSRRRRR